MGRRNIKQVVLPLITAFIWGSAIVAQSISTNYIGTFTFNALFAGSYTIRISSPGAAALLVTQTPSLLLYFPFLAVSGSLAGLFTGLCAQLILPRLRGKF